MNVRRHVAAHYTRDQRQHSVELRRGVTRARAMLFSDASSEALVAIGSLFAFVPANEVVRRGYLHVLLVKFIHP